MRTMHIGIAGAGLLGRLLACALARAGHGVTVFDPADGPLARGAAGWTAAGMLSPVAELECADAGVLRLGRRALDLWPGIVAGLAAPVDFAQRGSLLLAHRGDDGAARRIVDLLRRKAPQDAWPRALQAQELAQCEPAVHGPALGWLLPHEGQIDTVQAMAALAQTATARGVCWRWRCPVEAVGPAFLQAGGTRHGFDHVFDVRGTGARRATPVAGAVADRIDQVRGVRGEILCLHAPGIVLYRPLRLLHPRHRVYLVPRRGDTIVVGASEIESEDRSPISLRSTVELLAAAHSVIPALAEARIVHHETNLRPALPDNLPCIQQAPGCTRINGLFRHGWLVAPALVEQALAGMAALQPQDLSA